MTTITIERDKVERWLSALEVATRFVYQDNRPEQAHATGQRLKGLCRSSEAVITMAGFISHSTENLIKSRNGNLIRVAGGMSSLRTELNRFVTEGESA